MTGSPISTGWPRRRRSRSGPVSPTPWCTSYTSCRTRRCSASSMRSTGTGPRSTRTRASRTCSVSWPNADRACWRPTSSSCGSNTPRWRRCRTRRRPPRRRPRCSLRRRRRCRPGRRSDRSRSRPGRRGAPGGPRRRRVPSGRSRCPRPARSAPTSRVTTSRVTTRGGLTSGSSRRRADSTAASVPRITLLGKPGCHLCDDARAVIERVAAELGEPWEERDITRSAEDTRQYWEQIPVYLRALHSLQDRGIATVSSEELAAATGVNSAKLRKDLSHLGSYGTRGVGYDVDYLVYQVSRELGLTQDWPVVIVGAGNLGRALANYGGFASRGFRIAAVLDADAAVVGTEIAEGQVVGSSDAIEEVVAQRGVSIGVIATPAAAAQGVCDRLVAAGVTSILNFAPVVLSVPGGVDVRKVDLSIELQILAFHAQRRSDVRVAPAGKRHYRNGVGLAALAGSAGEPVTAP